MNLLRSQDPDAQVFAAEMLGQVSSATPLVLRLLTAALSSKAASRSGRLLREKAAWALAEWGPDAKPAVPMLKALLKDSN